LRRPWLAIALALAAAALVTVPSAAASRYIQHGIFDDAQINYGDPDKVFPQLKLLNTQLVRVNLVWGGPNGVSKRKLQPRWLTTSPSVIPGTSRLQ